jgi:hypothetical protein
VYVEDPKNRRSEEDPKSKIFARLPLARRRPAAGADEDLGPRIRAPDDPRGVCILDPRSPSPREARPGQHTPGLLFEAFSSSDLRIFELSRGPVQRDSGGCRYYCFVFSPIIASNDSGSTRAPLSRTLQ